MVFLSRRAVLAAALAALSRPLGAAGRLGIARPDWDYNLFLTYGQSLSTGSEGTPSLSSNAPPGNLMLGAQVLSTANIPSGIVGDRPSWLVKGPAMFEPLTAAGSAETVMNGALATLRHLAGAAAPPSRHFVAAGAGVGGRGIAALSKGAVPEYFHRVPTLVAQMQDAARAAGGSFGVAGMLWLQGESDMTMERGPHLALLRRMRADLIADAVPKGQAPPGFFTYQTIANAQNDRHGLGVQMAQLRMALDDPGVFMAGPVYPVPDSNNLHLTANGYRWLGSQFGKVMHRVLYLGEDWKPLHPLRALRQGRRILVEFHVPEAPLAWGLPYLSDKVSGPNRIVDHPDKGFTVLSGARRLEVAAVALDGPARVALTLSADPPPGPLLLRYADGIHAGTGNLRDSDPTLAADRYRMGVKGQTAGEALPELDGQPYPLWNWCVAFEMPVG
jgi:hypothetical protein